MKPIIEFKDYTFKYRSQVDPTLYNINLAVYPGEKVLIVDRPALENQLWRTVSTDWFLFRFPGKARENCR